MAKLFEEFCVGVPGAGAVPGADERTSAVAANASAVAAQAGDVAPSACDVASSAAGVTGGACVTDAVCANAGVGSDVGAGFCAKNRLVRAATCESLATHTGRSTPELLSVYRDLACGGVGTIITGFANVVPDDKPAPNMMGIYDDTFAEEWQPLTHLAHEYGARMVLQIVHGGSASRESAHAGARVLGASAVRNPKTGIVPEAATADELQHIVQAFGAAARRAREAGFDGVEIHAAHGYLLSQFLSPLLNRREDAYGGSVENRARLAVEIIDACRRAAGADFPLFVKVNSSDGICGGLQEDESLQAARMFAVAGAAAIEVSGNWHACRVSDFCGRPFFEDYALRLAHDVCVPVILTGGNRDFSTMEEQAIGGIAAFGLCRPFICEPNLAQRWQENPYARPHCVSCTACYKTAGHRCVHEPLR